MIEPDDQKEVCQRWKADFLAVSSMQKIGIAQNVAEGVLPINGLRHQPTGDTSGWYIWGGSELSTNDDFFHPLHAAHVGECCPEIEKYLGLAPGWRFLITPEYEDVWFDPSLLS